MKNNARSGLVTLLLFAVIPVIIFGAPEWILGPLRAAQGTTITTMAGTGKAAFCGDAGPASNACLNLPIGIVVNRNNDLFIADTFNNRIRHFKSGGSVTTLAGNGVGGFCGDDGPATSACLNGPEAVALDENGNLLIADTFNNRIRKVNTSGIISTVAGNGTADFCGDNGAGASSCLNGPRGVAVDNEGSIFIADTFNNRIRRIANGTITTVAGNGTAGFCGDNGPAPSACLQFPLAVVAGSHGDLYVTDLGNQRIRRIHEGIITTVAGNGVIGFCGDTGLATSACLSSPVGLAIDAGGNLFIADSGNQRIRQVSPAGVITTVAGSGTSGFCGDGGLAIDACLNGPTGVALDTNDLFIADQLNSRIRRVR